jgi:outer membrane protein OmpA-like peptidoglycan-associated protein
MWLNVREASVGTQRLVAMAAASLVAAAPVVTWAVAPASAASTRTATPNVATKPTPIAGACPTTPTGGTPEVSNRQNGAETPLNSSGAYYGNPKLDVVVAPTAPGLCPSFPDTTADATDQLADLVGFRIKAEPTTGPAETPAPTCTTEPIILSAIVAATDGTCEMDPAGTKTFPMQVSSGTSFHFTVASGPLGWAADPDTPPAFDATIYPCDDVAGTDGCATSEPPDVVNFFVNADDVFSYIGIFRHVAVTVTSAVTGQRMAGVTVALACKVPAGQPADVCPAAATAKSDAQGMATFSGLYAPGAPLTLTETGLPAPYKSVTLATTAPSPVTAATKTGAEISAATEVTAGLTVSPTATLATITRHLVEGTSIHLTGLGAATSGLTGLTVTSVGRARHGKVVLRDGAITYTPTRTFVGADTFTYGAGVAGGLATGHVDLTVTRAAAPKTAWYHDSVSAAGRQGELVVPADPAAYSGPERVTRAWMRTRGGSFAVPLDWAFGHTLVAHEALALTGASLFAFNSPTLTPNALALLRRLDASLHGVEAITCQGFSDYGALASHEQALSLERAQAVCAVLDHGRPGLATTSMGYGGTDPVVVGGGPSPLNRRVVIVVTKSAPR